MAPTSEMPAPAAQQQLQQASPAEERQGYAKLTHHLSLWLLFACPAIALLPPRKLDMYTFGLGAMTLVSAEHLVRERTGRTIMQRVSSGFEDALSQDELPTERARQMQEIQRRAKEQRESLLRSAGAGSEKESQKEAEHKQNALQRAWMGGETEGWRERRLKEEREAIEDGRGYGGLIMDQIWEVWNWGKGKSAGGGGDDLKEKGADADSKN